MDSIFRSRILTEAVNNIKTVPTLILDTVFARKKYELSEQLAWDVITGNETILKNLKATDASSIADGVGRKTVTTAAPRFAEKRLVTLADLNALRGFGEQFRPELMARKIAEEQADMKAKIDRTREFMAASCLDGKIYDSDGTTVLVDYGLTGTHTVTLTGTDLWTDTESNPLKKIRAWKKLIAQAVNTVDRFVAFVGTDAMDALLENAAVKSYMQYQMGAQIAQSGRIVRLAEVDLVEYSGSYVNGSGTRTDLIGAKYFKLVGISNENAAELYVPTLMLSDPSGVGKGQAAQMFSSDSWEQKDPDGRWIRVESRPLPVLFKPDCIVNAKVVA